MTLYESDLRLPNGEVVSYRTESPDALAHIAAVRQAFLRDYPQETAARFTRLWCAGRMWSQEQSA